MTATGNAPILVGVDGSLSALHATEWAARAAALRHAPLTLVATMATPAPYGAGVGLPPTYFDDLEQEGRRRLGEAADAAKHAAGEAAGLVIHTEYHLGNPVPVLRDRAKAARMLVLGTRGLGEFTGTFVGSTAVSLVSHGSCPVVVVRGSGPDARPPADGPVVVGVDGSPASEGAVAAAFEEAALRGARLVAVHAWSDAAVSSMFGVPEVPWDEIETSERVVLAERLAGWQERYPEVDVERVVTQDRPVRSLLHHAAQAQLLVVGSRGRGGFSGMLLGSTSNALVYTAPCPLLVMRGRRDG
ncbi:universal stress protein [Prauserella muralis]|uniref:Universal stress protein n=1 Tax=Prauserella muralis TaxID=588067 RepID=A0A2V4APE4_9PSEU|nr:universal stress protein [Prauserella muralis]PXY22328.1 universal stress protein [Prauserella muralis]TWE27980.1 nucleotide-binding universal stress UspA family protein [Prauserella muralis]